MTVLHLFHVRGGFREGYKDLSSAQNAIAKALKKACRKIENVNFDSKGYTRDEFIDLLRNAPPNAIIYFDGHGAPSGHVVFADKDVSGDEIREHRNSSATVFLHCCFSVKIATADSKDLKNIRNKVATLLATGPGNIKEEVNLLMHSIETEYADMDDDGFLARRIAEAMKGSGGLDRFGKLFDGICPLSVGAFQTQNDGIIIDVVSALLYLLSITGL